MSDQRNGLEARDSHIWSLRMAVLVLGILCGVLIGVVTYQQSIIKIQVPPDLSKGALVKPGDYYPSYNYSFALHVWRDINEWRISGRKDLPAKLTTNECYVTPSFYKWLENQKEQKARDGELDRSRRMVPLSPYREESVINLGANTFSVTLNLNLIEDVNGSAVKNVNIRYPIRVVPDYRTCNKTGLALDGFYAEPSRITEEELKVL